MNDKPCPSCGSNDLDELLCPYCSEVCWILGSKGLGWRTHPCRIVDSKTGVVVASGPSFDLSAEGISRLVRETKTARRQEARAHSSAHREVAEMDQIKRSIGGSLSISGVENAGPSKEYAEPRPTA